MVCWWVLAPHGEQIRAAFSLMNLRGLIRVLEVGFNRTDLEDAYPEFANNALRLIQQEHDWARTRDTAELSIPSGGSSVSLPSNFRALVKEQFPVMVRTQADTAWLGCPVESEEYCLRFRGTTFFPPLRVSQFAVRSGITVFLTKDQSGDSLGLVAPAAEDLVFRVAYFGYLRPLEAETDKNFLTEEYPSLVEHKVLAVAFARINDEAMVAAHETLYAEHLRKAVADDTRRSNQGRRLRVGV